MLGQSEPMYLLLLANWNFPNLLQLKETVHIIASYIHAPGNKFYIEFYLIYLPLVNRKK